MDKNINPEILIIARESRGITQSGLAKVLKISQGKISKIEAGLQGISDDILKKLSEKLNYPEGFFFQTERIYGAGIAFIFHRSRKSLPQKVAATIESQISIHRLIITRLLRSVEIDINFPEFEIEDYNDNVEDIARAVRATWLLPRGPIRNLTEIIERMGGIIIKCDFGTSKIDALSQYVPGTPPLFFINNNIPGDRLRFSLCHELGHVIMHRIPRPEMEKEADGFASEFLMPASEIKSSLNKVSLSTLASLKPYWKVAMQALLVRAKKLGTITERSASYIWMQISKAGYRKQEPAELSIPVEEPASMSKLIDIYLKQLNYSIADLSRFLAIHPHELRENYLGELRKSKVINFNNYLKKQ